MANKEQFLYDLNKAFASNNVDYITKCVTENIQWNIVGEDTIKGKTNFTKALIEMGMENDELFDLQIDDMIIYQHKGVVEGTMSTHEEKVYAFCDIYTFASGVSPLIEQLTSYVITMKKKPVKL